MTKILSLIAGLTLLNTFACSSLEDTAFEDNDSNAEGLFYPGPTYAISIVFSRDILKNVDNENHTVVEIPTREFSINYEKFDEGPERRFVIDIEQDNDPKKRFTGRFYLSHVTQNRSNCVIYQKCDADQQSYESERLNFEVYKAGRPGDIPSLLDACDDNLECNIVKLKGNRNRSDVTMDEDGNQYLEIDGSNTQTSNLFRIIFTMDPTIYGIYATSYKINLVFEKDAS